MYNNIHGWNVTKDTPFCHSSLPSTQSARHIKLECHLPQWSAPWLKFSLVCALFCAIVWLKHTKSAKFLAVALHLMVQKPTSAWLVDGWRHTFVSTREPPTSSCFVVLDRCCHRAPKAQETLAKHVCVACRCQRPQPW